MWLDNDSEGDRMRAMNEQTLYEAIVEGIERASNKGLTKPSDIAFSIMVSIDNAGLEVIRSAKQVTKKSE